MVTRNSSLLFVMPFTPTVCINVLEFSINIYPDIDWHKRGGLYLLLYFGFDIILIVITIPFQLRAYVIGIAIATLS